MDRRLKIARHCKTYGLKFLDEPFHCGDEECNNCNKDAEQFVNYVRNLEDEFIANIAENTFKEASIKAMKTIGYIVIAEDGWIIKKFADGTKEKIIKFK